MARARLAAERNRATVRNRVRFLQATLERDSQAVARAQFRRTRESHEQFERQIFQLRVLHVEVDEYAEISSPPQDGQQPVVEARRSP